jgi:ATPase inhibitor, mitochondrial
MSNQSKDDSNSSVTTSLERNFEGGYGGQEDLEDRYATTSGEH